jgi:hypothetical protein
LSPNKFRHEYIKFEMLNIKSDEMIGIRIEVSLFAQNPRIGEKMNCPRGFAATMKPKKSFFAEESSCFEGENAQKYLNSLTLKLCICREIFQVKKI